MNIGIDLGTTYSAGRIQTVLFLLLQTAKVNV